MGLRHENLFMIVLVVKLEADQSIQLTSFKKAW